MSNGHGSSRRQAYGRRMKELRRRRGSAMEVDLEGPAAWNRGGAWDEERPMARGSMNSDMGSPGSRSR